MSDYDDNNKLAIWANDNRASERHPHYKGSGIVNGQEVWVSAWLNESDNPKAPAMKISLTPKTDVAQQGAAQTRQATGLSIPPVQGQAQRPAAAMPDAAMPDASAAQAMPFKDDIPF